MGFVGLMRRSLSGQRNIRMHVCCLSRSSKNTPALHSLIVVFFFFSPNENVKLCRWHIFRCLCRVYNSILPQTVLQVLPQSSHHSSHVSYHVTFHIFLACWSQDDRLSHPCYVWWSQVQMRCKFSITQLVLKVCLLWDSEMGRNVIVILTLKLEFIQVYLEVTLTPSGYMREVGYVVIRVEWCKCKFIMEISYILL